MSIMPWAVYRRRRVVTAHPVLNSCICLCVPRFENHIAYDHNMWAYVNFLVHIRYGLRGFAIVSRHCTCPNSRASVVDVAVICTLLCGPARQPERENGTDGSGV